jgi:hypothetical protein
MSRNKNSTGTLNPYTVSGYEIMEQDRYGYKIVAVVHSKDFWTAYRGLTDWSDQHVALEGDTISYETAKLLFPTIAATIPNYNL